MAKHKTQNTFYWITYKVNKVYWWNLASLCHITKERFLSKNFTKSATWKVVPGPFVVTKNEALPLLENEIFDTSYLILDMY